MEEALDDGELSLEMTGRVMEFDVDGNMIVNYSERLVSLLRDSRQLAELGLAVPDRVKKAAADAEKYYRFGIMLKKVGGVVSRAGLCSWSCSSAPWCAVIYRILVVFVVGHVAVDFLN